MVVLLPVVCAPHIYDADDGFTVHRLHLFCFTGERGSELLPVYACGVAPERKNAAARVLYENTEGVGVDHCQGASA